MPKQRERWIAAHQALGHDPHPAPTQENPERWECKCDPDAVPTAIWRILTPASRSGRSSPISRRRDASRRPPRRWGKTPAVTMPHLGGLPASPIREVRMQNYRVGPPPLGGGRWRADVPGPALVRRYSSDESSPGCGLGWLGSSPSD